jgi:hypothetical protein
MHNKSWWGNCMESSHLEDQLRRYGENIKMNFRKIHGEDGRLMELHHD